MPFQPGHTKVPGSGRKPGTMGTKLRETVAEVCARVGCNPFEAMAAIVVDEDCKLDLRGRMAAELAQYLAPKLRAIEHSGPGGGAIDVRMSSAEELRRKVDALKERVARKPQ